jgi:DNA-3-methyladenine glycosylase II
MVGWSSTESESFRTTTLVHSSPRCEELGPWTADLFLLGQLGRADILPAGDLGIRRAVQVAYELRAMPTEREVLRIGEGWRPYRSLATAYLYNSLRVRPTAND